MNQKIKTFDKYFRQEQSEISEAKKNLFSEIRECLTTAGEITTILQSPLILDEEKRVPTKSIFPKVSPNQDIVMVGAIGLAGTVFMAKYFRNDLVSRLPGWMVDDTLRFCEDISRYPSSAILEKYNVSAAYPVSEGGLRRVLYQLGKDTQKGYCIDPHTVPIHQITIEFCEYYDIDPWRLLSCGCTLLVTPHGNALMRELHSLEIPSAIIGYTTDNRDKLLVYDDVQSRVNRPEPDGLLSILLT